MSTGNSQNLGGVAPTDAWAILSAEKDARLIDVRTQAEWGFVGAPDLSEIGQTLIRVEWASFPGMSQNPNFVDAVLTELGDEAPGKLLFLCRSGVRSLAAAKAITEHFSAKGVSVTCLNVEEGFEGDLDANGHRGLQNGWRLRGLAWRQS